MTVAFAVALPMQGSFKQNSSHVFAPVVT